MNKSGDIFHQHNVRLHVLVNTVQKLKGFSWDVLNYSYSPDIVPIDYCLFRSLEHSFRESNFVNLSNIKNHLDNFFALKPAKRFEKILENHGHYVID